MATQNRPPTSDYSFTGDWTGTAGSRYTAVNDYPDSSGSTYLEHGTNYGTGLMGFSAFSIPAGSTGISVQLQYYDQKTASQACNIAGRLVVGGNNYNAANHNPANGVWTAREDSWATNPKSLANWTVDDVNGVGANALQYAGWMSSDASPTIRLASFRAQVTYTPPAAGNRRRRVLAIGA